MSIGLRAAIMENRTSPRPFMPTNIFISAGEASGEHYGVLLMEALKRRVRATGETLQFFGMGGPRMVQAGLEVVVRSEEMAVMGVTEVVRHLPDIYRGFRKLKQAIAERKPDVAVLIDFPDVHLKLSAELDRLGIPVIYFVSPQLWAWKKHRIKRVRKYVRRMLVIFPFEEGFYRERGVEAEFVGHPLAELAPPAITREQFAAENDLSPAATWIGLLPGSRLKEIRANLPRMLEAAKGLALAGGSATGVTEAYAFLLPVAPTLTQAQRAEVRGWAADGGHGLTLRFVDDARAALRHARASVVASGTATVEAALTGNPFVVVYRVSPLTYAVAKRVVSVPHVAMANLIAGRRIVPELIQNDFTAANVVQQLGPLLPEGAPRQSMMKGLEAIRGALTARPDGGKHAGWGAIERVAAIVVEELEARSLTGKTEPFPRLV
jgi:lipid-A-disaccharide synthase